VRQAAGGGGARQGAGEAGAQEGQGLAQRARAVLGLGVPGLLVAALLAGARARRAANGRCMDDPTAARPTSGPQVSHYIAICLEPEPNGKASNPLWEEQAATAAAVQNLWLMASALGLAGYWSSWQAVARDAPEMHEFLGLQRGQQCLGVFVLGRSDRAAGYRGSRDPVEERVTWRLE
jgi:nitroreductase